MNVDELRQRMAALPEPITSLQPPFWEFWRHQLWRLAQIDDPHKFTLWPCIYHTMLVRHWTKAILYEFSVVREFIPISPDEFSKDEYDNLIHQAYHILQWQQTTGKQIKDLKTIVEFGGGYGAMRLLCHRLGFKGRYIIYDLPEFSLLQEWYLSQHGIEAEWNPISGPKNIDLFMALYSLSEVPFNDRPRFELAARSYLFLYSGLWEGWDNVDYYQRQWPIMRPGLEWRHTEIGHLPDSQNWYSIGW